MRITLYESILAIAGLAIYRDSESSGSRSSSRREKLVSAAHVTDATFENDVLRSERTVIVDFWGDDCPPCAALAPIIDQLAAENADKVSIVKLYVAENPESVDAYGIFRIPTLKVFQDGEVVKTIIGGKPRHELKADLAEFLA
jgi:thioredoxin 1